MYVRKKKFARFWPVKWGLKEKNALFAQKKWPKCLEVEKKALPLHSQTGNNGTPQATL
jgi:hypothetical protein